MEISNDFPEQVELLEKDAIIKISIESLEKLRMQK